MFYMLNYEAQNIAISTLIGRGLRYIMAGKFLNTHTAYSQMVNQAAQTMKERLDNPYYLFSDKKASECTYYNINTTMSTLDEATRGNYAEISTHDPIRFNKIKNFMVYGISKIEPSIELTDYGAEGSDVTGECLILPRTIIPYPGDRFFLTQLDKPYLFRVTSVNPNTLETGATFYRCGYVLETSDGLKNIEPQVVKVFIFNINTGGIGSENGTNLTTFLIDEDAYNTVEDLQNISTALKDYYISMFYDSKIQSFAYLYAPMTDEWLANNGEPIGQAVNLQRVMAKDPFGFKVYDPYLIEFMIRNKILTGSSTYIHVSHQMFLEPSFAMDYDKTIFASIEDKDYERHYGRSVGNLVLCDQKLSLLYAFPQDYYYMRYHNLNANFFYVSIFDDPDFKNKIKNKEYTKHVFKNLIVKYFNNEKITFDDLKAIKHADYMSNKEFYYGIPLGIFIIEKCIAEILTQQKLSSQEVA